MGADGIVRHLSSLLAPVVAAENLLLEGVTVRASGKRRVVVVTVDLPDGPGGVGSDQLAGVSRAVSAALDADDAFPGPYVLEVSTPGVGRPLTEPRHFRRAAGRLVSLQTRARGTLRGRLVEADDDGVGVEPVTGPATAGGGARRVAYSEVVSGVVELELAGFDSDAREG